MRLNPRRALRRMPFRARLAAAISALFLAAGVVLLSFVVLLARYGTTQQIQGIQATYSNETTSPAPSSQPARPTNPGAAPPPAQDTQGRTVEVRKMDQTVQAVQDTALDQMIRWSAVGLLVTAVLAGLLGWWLAGRALRPVASMTQAARRISEQNLHQRLALTGPDDELHRLADTFDTMLDRLERSFASQRRFVANASHELKTPLAVQRTALEVGLADPLPEHLAEVRDDLLTANRDAEQLINSLLVLAKGDQGVETAVVVDLIAMARQSQAELNAMAVEKAVTVHVPAASPLLVHGDPVLLRHLLTNLIRNAIQYNHAGGHVHVDVGTRTLTVTNTGPRVPPDRIGSLFEPFRRLTRDRMCTTGHGLGLSIVRSIAMAHDADLRAQPGTDGGLKIALRFP
ncbi:HAMP domain-containing sensor histidine kinase [Streptomyces sp. PSAA01]|uniref:sensor histidine kinase n=1 Tax=Streptomyces sp. PSAA01 TaxID=2912762 RepID=UPI001F32C8F4|nr:HAMP domain-containing sensor histidine kinase [Streptomyces sp. PSAA01]MCG0289026.1 HAMP domain-containing histidine kinase [Streptomyces sp. PSAA01]